jgi:hypothetical protein
MRKPEGAFVQSDGVGLLVRMRRWRAWDRAVTFDVAVFGREPSTRWLVRAVSVGVDEKEDMRHWGSLGQSTVEET